MSSGDREHLYKILWESIPQFHPCWNISVYTKVIERQTDNGATLLNYLKEIHRSIKARITTSYSSKVKWCWVSSEFTAGGPDPSPDRALTNLFQTLAFVFDTQWDWHSADHMGAICSPLELHNLNVYMCIYVAVFLFGAQKYNSNSRREQQGKLRQTKDLKTSKMRGDQ